MNVEIEMKLETPLAYAEAAIDTMRRRFSGPDLPPKNHFHYHQGVFLSGVNHTYQLDSRKEYFEYLKSWVDSYLTEFGEILHHDRNALDDIQPGILLFPCFDATGDERYRCAMDQLTDDLDVYPKNDEGGYWHNDRAPRQMWLDGLYMGGPFMVEYGSRFGRPDMVEEAIDQSLLMREKTRTANGLWRHAYDPDRAEPWADPTTGLSPEYWGRSMGWVPVAVLDELDHIGEDNPRRKDVEELVRDLLVALCHYQGPDGRWWQIVDKVGGDGNWPENSCTCLYVAGLCKAVYSGILDEGYLENASRGYRGVIDSLSWHRTKNAFGETVYDLQVGDVCVGTGVGDYEFYCRRPTSVNDLHGVGAFLLMCAECQRAGVR